MKKKGYKVFGVSKKLEYELFNIEKIIINNHLNIDIGELEMVDFGENAEILTEEERRNKFDYLQSKGIMDDADICLHYNP